MQKKHGFFLYYYNYVKLYIKPNHNLIILYSICVKIKICQ